MSFLLTGEEFAIGRDPSNRLSIEDPSVSRRHCLIRREGARFRISDLDSSNGTFVQGRPIQDHVLEPDEEIQIGTSRFVFSVPKDGVAQASGTVHFEEGVLLTESTVLLRREDALYLHPNKVLDALPPPARLARDLNTLLRISTVIQSVRSLHASRREPAEQSIEPALLDLIFEAIPAERGAILLADDGPEEFSSAYGRERAGESSEPVAVSRTIVRQVLRERVALLNNDLLHSEQYREAKSVARFRIRSVIAVPLIAGDNVLGVIYLDTRDQKARFDEGHLQLLTAISSVAALAVENARYVESLESENRRLQEEIRIEHSMIGESPRMREVYQFIARVAPTDSTVLIRGESGTGKELVARAVHENSSRAEKPFVAINCAAITETLLESELFGHEKGAFTGATAQKRGKLEIANGGTVFLDEVAEISPHIQAKLLRVIQERQFERVGGTRPIQVDIRLLAATNQDLEAAMQAKTFRQDLYYRLNVVSVTMPPLRDRREDIPLLANYFVARYAEKCKRRLNGISPEARLSMMNYDWPGNVRELENTIERAVVLGSSEVIRLEDLPEPVLEVECPPGVASTRYHEALQEFKKQLIVKAVEQARGNYTEAAKLLDLHPNYLHRLINKLNLRSAVKARL
jgi:Nif-specific regulatory protein